MDPDPEAAYDAASQFAKATVITVAISTCAYYETQTGTLRLQRVEPEPKQSVSKYTKPANIKKKKQTLYLSFDDGPNKGTRNVMHIASEENIPVTLFLVGEHVNGSPFQRATWDSLKHCAMIELGNHSYSHAHHKYDQYYKLPDSVVSDFRRCKDSLRLASNVCRTPGRNIWRTSAINSTDIAKSAVAADSLETAGFKLIGWDVEWHYDNRLFMLNHQSDSLMRLIDSAFSKKKTKTTDHLVLLAHDQAYADALDSADLHNFFKQLKKDDRYNLEFISNYPGVKDTVRSVPAF